MRSTISEANEGMVVAVAVDETVHAVYAKCVDKT